MQIFGFTTISQVYTVLTDKRNADINETFVISESFCINKDFLP